jgi:LPXTG-motif cell wall-anchored protein
MKKKIIALFVMLLVSSFSLSVFACHNKPTQMPTPKECVTPTPEEATPTPEEATPTPEKATPTPEEEMETPDESIAPQDEDTESEESALPKTGESSSVVIYIVGGIIILAGLGTFVFLKKKNSSK